MDANEIDNLFNAIDVMDTERVVRYAGMQTDNSGEIDFDNEEYVSKVLGNLMNKIEEGDYSYFLTKMQDNKSAFLLLMCYCSNIEDKKKCINEVIGDSEHINETIINLIKSTDDPEYIKECISRKETLGNFDPEQLCSLIKATNDPEYIKECIDKREEFGGFDNDDLCSLIKATNDPEYIKECIDKREELKISKSGNLFSLIKSTNDPEYIRECISKKNELGIWWPGDLRSLVEATGDSEYIKSCIKKRDEFQFRSDDLAILIGATKDVEYIKESIGNRQELGIDDPQTLLKLIKATEDSKYIKDCIKKRDEFQLGSAEISELIVVTKDNDYIRDCIGNAEELGLAQQDKLKLAISTKDEEYVEQFLTSIDKEEKSDSKIKLPPNMTIGVEIESEGGASSEIKNLSNIIVDKWQCKLDGSLQNGVEVVSPILTGDMEKCTDDVKKVCGRLQGLRTRCFRKMWRTYTYWSRLFN